MADYSDFIKNNVAPYAAKKIGVYNSSGTRVGSISLGEFKPDYGERLYRFGIISDVHNEENEGSHGYEPEAGDDLFNALTYFNDKESIEFTLISGDLTQYSYSTKNIATEMAIFQTNKNRCSPGTPVYPTTGNHDCPQSSDIDISTFYSYTDVADIAPSDGAEYSYELTKTHTTSAGNTVTDHFLFLTMKRYEFTTNTYSSTDITWLANKLEAYKNDRCFVITHMFFPTYAGNLNDIYPSGNWLSGTMLTQLKALIDAYPRSIWFSGHSHWKWYLQKYQNRANVYPITNIDRTCGWAVHIPSCAYPIDSDGSSRTAMYAQSEGGVVDVYEDYIDIRGIEFKGSGDTDYNTKYIPVAQYRLYTAPGQVTSVKTVLAIKLDAGNEALQLAIPSTSYKYIKYNEVIVNLEDGTDITSTIQSTTATSGDTNNTSYKLGLYAYADGAGTDTGYYQIAPAGTTATMWVDTTNTAVRIAQSSGSSPIIVTSGHTVYIQYRGIKYSDDGTTWTEITSDNAELTNGSSISSYSKDDCEYKWVSSVAANGKDHFDGGSDTGETTAKSVLCAYVNIVSAGIGIAIGDTSTEISYIKYSNIKITDANGNDVTTAITSTATGSSNSYKVGVYNSATVYCYVPANTVLATDNNKSYSTSYVIPIVQSSSSSSVATTPLYVQLEGIKWSNTGDDEDWTDFNSNSNTLVNGTNWGKKDLTYTWIETITDDPTTLTFES